MRRVICLVIAVLPALPAHAELYKCIDGEGRTTYSETKDPKAKCTVAGGAITVVPYQAPANRSEERQPVKQRQRDAIQQQIDTQEAALVEAKKALQEQGELRLGSEKNYQRVLDRLKPYQDRVTEIEQSLAALRAELAKTP